MPSSPTPIDTRHSDDQTPPTHTHFPVPQEEHHPCVVRHSGLPAVAHRSSPTELPEGLGHRGWIQSVLHLRSQLGPWLETVVTEFATSHRCAVWGRTAQSSHAPCPRSLISPCSRSSHPGHSLQLSLSLSLFLLRSPSSWTFSLFLSSNEQQQLLPSGLRPLGGWTPSLRHLWDTLASRTQDYAHSVWKAQ